MSNDIRTLFPRRQVYILNNPVSLKDMINKRGVARDPNRLLYLGWYSREKGVYDLVDAIERLLQKGKNLEAEFYGTKGINTLRGYVYEKRLEEKIAINGWVDDDKKLEALFRATMLILPSYTEGVPNVILEAMATRTPIVSTLVGGLAEILQDNRNAMIAEVKNFRDLSRRIERCLEDEVLRRTLAENAYKYVKEHHDMATIRTHFKRIVSSLE